MTGTKKRAQKSRPLLEPLSDEGNSSFARALGSVDYRTREQGLQALTVFLSTRRDMPRPDMLKLWKGLFYCFWHSDKEPVQVRSVLREAPMLYLRVDSRFAIRQ